MVATLVIEALLGVLLYVAVFRPLRNALPLAKAVGSLGVMILLTAIVGERAGADQIIVAPFFPRENSMLAAIRTVSSRLWPVLTLVAGTPAVAAGSRCHA